MDTSTQMTENSSGFNVFRDPHAVHGDRHGDAAPGGGGGPRVAVVDSAAARQEALAARDSPAPARPSRWAAGVLAAPTSRTPACCGCLGGETPGAGSKSCPWLRLAPPSPAQRATRAVGWPRRRPRGMRTTWRAGPPLGAADGKEDEEIVVHDIVVQKVVKKKHTDDT